MEAAVVEECGSQQMIYLGMVLFHQEEAMDMGLEAEEVVEELPSTCRNQ